MSEQTASDAPPNPDDSPESLPAGGGGSVSYETLMPHTVQNVLLVASEYDSFILEEEGRFSDRLLGQYLELDLSKPPAFHHVASARQALERLGEGDYDLVVTTPHIADASPQELAAEIADRQPETPVVLLTYDRFDAQSWAETWGAGGWDGTTPRGVSSVFLWTGDPRLLLAMVKSVEDRMNVDHDTEHGLVRVILVVEDQPSVYSSFLPIIYAELLAQIRSLLADRLNERDRNFRMRARPKILLARSYEEGERLVRRYRDYLLGMISDVRFPRGGRPDDKAGIDLIRYVRGELPDLPVLLQSRDLDNADLARELDVGFVDKSSPELLSELRVFMRRHFGFGPFIFRLEGAEGEVGEEVGRAETIQEMVEALRRVPVESLQYHAARNHVSNWLMARGEFPLALEVRPKQVSDFADMDEVRDYLVRVFSHFLERRQRGQVTDFRGRPDPLQRDFLRLGRGSMGGKARSIAFVSRLKARSQVEEELARKYPDVDLIVPRTVVICTDVFDRFVARSNLRERAMAADSDEAVAEMFLEQPLNVELTADLASILREVRYPLAVRSSSLLEDSEYQPLAGLYKTYLLPNCAGDDKVRLDQLSRAIRLVFASTFFRAPRTCMEATGLRIEEEKMAVIVQRLVGRRYGDRFYPHFAGVAQSYNYYPLGETVAEEGIVTVALGFGHSVVDGANGLRFNPHHPEALPGMSTAEEMLRNSQRTFLALDLGDPEAEISLDDEGNLRSLDLEVAEADGTLEPVGATWSAANDRIYDTLHREGPRLVNFAGVLKHGRFPLAPMLADVLELGETGMGTPLELEFAATVGEGEAGGDGDGGSRRSELALLQLRPLVAQGREQVGLDRGGGTPLVAGPALGNGIITGIGDVVYLHPARVDFEDTPALARAVQRVNDRLVKADRPYLLLGPGRWGTADRFLGVPVKWNQVSGARVIVELATRDGGIDPSQGTHFFHNITALRIGYFNLDRWRDQGGDGAGAGDGQLVDFPWLDALPAVEEDGALRHVELPAPAEARIDGSRGRGVVIRGA